MLADNVYRNFQVKLFLINLEIVKENHSEGYTENLSDRGQIQERHVVICSSTGKKKRPQICITTSLERKQSCNYVFEFLVLRELLSVTIRRIQCSLYTKCSQSFYTDMIYIVYHVHIEGTFFNRVPFIFVLCVTVSLC